MNHVNYDLTVYHDKLVSKRALFTDETTGLAKASTVFQGEQTIPRLLDFCRELGCDDAFRRMCILDALTLNPDRHYGNFGFLFDNETMELKTLAPMFDNNRALFPELDEEQLAALHDFRFSNHSQHPISETRLGLLDSLVQHQLERILE